MSVDPEWNTAFHMPDSFYDPPDDPCECEGEGCHLCDKQVAYDLHISTDPRI